MNKQLFLLLISIFSICNSTVPVLNPSSQRIGSFGLDAKMRTFVTDKTLVAISDHSGEKLTVFDFNGAIKAQLNKDQVEIINNYKILDSANYSHDGSKRVNLFNNYSIQDDNLISCQKLPKKFSITIYNLIDNAINTFEIDKIKDSDALHVTKNFLVHTAEVFEPAKRAFIYDFSGKLRAEVRFEHFEKDFEDIYDSYIAVHPENLKILILSESNKLYLYDLTGYNLK